MRFADGGNVDKPVHQAAVVYWPGGRPVAYAEPEWELDWVNHGTLFVTNPKTEERIIVANVPWVLLDKGRVASFLLIRPEEDR